MQQYILNFIFQTILCAEMCSEESQEQIVTQLATFVQTKSDLIGSAWKPLFSALKGLRMEHLNGT